MPSLTIVKTNEVSYHKSGIDYIRSVLDWISAHKIVSFIVLIAVVAAVSAVRYVAHSSAGTLSAPIEKGKIVDAVYGIGTVTANRRLSFNPLIANTVRKTFVKEGDLVKKGRPLIETDNGALHLAPFDGVVNYLPYKAGENTYTNSPTIIFTDMADRYVVVSMEQQGALRTKVGQVARLSFDSLRHSTFEGRVSAVYSYNSSFLARVDGIKLPDSILPDMTCDVAIVVSVHENALTIPIVAFENGRVWVKRGKQLPHPVPVKLGVVDTVMAEVVEGDVQPGDQLLIRKQVGP